MKKWMVNALKISIALIGVIILILCIFWLPDMARRSAEMNPEYEYLRYPVLLGLYITCIPFYFGVFHTLKLLRLIEGDGAFTEDACKSLGIINLNAIGEIVLYTIGITFLFINNALHPGILLIGITIIFAAFIIAIFASILKGLLMKVVEIKNENDFTI